MTLTSSHIHMLVDRPIVEHTDQTYPSITFRDSPRTEMGASVTLSVTGELSDRLAFAAELRALADFIETWERPVDEDLEAAVSA